MTLPTMRSFSAIIANMAVINAALRSIIITIFCTSDVQAKAASTPNSNATNALTSFPSMPITALSLKRINILYAAYKANKMPVRFMIFCFGYIFCSCSITHSRKHTAAFALITNAAESNAGITFSPNFLKALIPRIRRPVKFVIETVSIFFFVWVNHSGYSDHIFCIKL